MIFSDKDRNPLVYIGPYAVWVGGYFKIDARGITSEGVDSVIVQHLRIGFLLDGSIKAVVRK